MKNYKFGFSLKCLLLYLLQLFPNIIWMLFPPENDILAGNSASYEIFNDNEHIFGILTIAILILVMNKSSKKTKYTNIFKGLAFLCLAGYYISWVFYLSGAASPWLLVLGIAGMVPFYFFFIGLWQKNYLVLIPCIIFAITHIAITCSNYL